MATIDADSKPPEPTTGEPVLSLDREPIGALLRHSFDALALTDRGSRRTVEVSDSFCALTGYSREELIGRTSVEIGLIAEDSQRARVIEQVDQGQEGLYERTVRRKDGEARRVEFSHTLLPGGLVLTRLRDITEQCQSAEKLRESEERFRRAVESMLEGFAICSPVRDEQGEIVDFRYEFVNDAACQLNDLPRERMIGHRIGELFPAYVDGELFRAQRRVLETGEARRIDELLYEGGWAGRGPVVRAFDSSIVPLGDGIAVSWRDVTERRRLELETGAAQRRAERVARVYGTLSMAYEAIVRIRERLPLFEEVCRVLVEQGQLRMAWVGEVDDHGWIVPVAHAGVTDGYLDDLRVSVLDVAEGRGPTGTAAREHRHLFITDIASDERMRPWREAALARGYRSSAAFPLIVDDRCAAVLTAYAPEPRFFDEQEVDLFDRMAADLSFALEAMRRDERRRALEAELRASEERFRVAAESMLDGFAIVSPVRVDGKIKDFLYRYVNDAYCRLVGFDRGRLLDRRVGELFPQFLGSDRFEVYRRVALTGEPCRTDELQLPSTWAQTAFASRVFDTVIASMGEELVVLVRDITGRKRTEQERERALAELQEAQQIAQLGSWHWDPATGARTWSAGMYAVYGRDPGGGPIGTEESFAWVHPDDLERVQSAYARMLEGGDRFELDYRLRTGDRGMRMVHAIARPDPDRPGSYRGTLQDVTELREAEKELQLRAELLDLAHDAVIVRDPVDSRVRFWNREAERIYGYTRAEAADRVSHELLATVFPESREAVGEALAREGKWVGELRHTRKDGEVIVVSSRQALQRGEDGRPLAIIELNSDITARERAEEQLARMTALLERTQEITKTGGWEYDVATGNLTWTDEVYRIYGLEPTSDPPAVPEAIAAYDPDSAALIEAAFSRLVADGEPYDLELGLVRADGERIWVRTIGRPVIEDGRIVRVGGHIADITERKRAEEALAEITGLLERTQQISTTGGWEYGLATGKLTLTDEVYRIYGSSERRYGPVEPEQAISAFDPESAPIVSTALERLVAAGEPFDLEVGLVRADGQRIWVRAVGEAVIEGGRVVRVRGIIADVTDRRQVEEEIRALNAELEQRVAARTMELERVNHELETFAYSVSHDLRAPLRAVDGFSKVLLDDYAEKLGGDGRHYLERVRAGAVRMGTLIDEILKLSRLSRQRFEREPIDLSALAGEIVAELSGVEADREVEVEIEDGLVAEADRGLVQSVLQNLLGNAFKFTAKTDRARVHFGAFEQDGVPVYFVADNGAGFDMVHAKGLFRPFQRLHRENEFPGTGIGLATVVRAVHRHGGTIWAHGAVHEGATFCFTLTPGAQPPADAATGEDVAPRWQPPDQEGSP